MEWNVSGSHFRFGRVSVPVGGRDDASDGVRRHQLPGAVAEAAAATRLPTTAGPVRKPGRERARYVCEQGGRRVRVSSLLNLSGKLGSDGQVARVACHIIPLLQAVWRKSLRLCATLGSVQLDLLFWNKERRGGPNRLCLMNSTLPFWKDKTTKPT